MNIFIAELSEMFLAEVTFEGLNVIVNHQVVLQATFARKFFPATFELA